MKYNNNNNKEKHNLELILNELIPFISIHLFIYTVHSLCYLNRSSSSYSYSPDDIYCRNRNRRCQVKKKKKILRRVRVLFKKTIE